MNASEFAYQHIKCVMCGNLFDKDKGDFIGDMGKVCSNRICIIKARVEDMLLASRNLSQAEQRLREELSKEVQR